MGEFPVERGYVWTSCASVENGNPLFWDDDVADELTGGPIAPPSMVSVWFRPHHWAPGRTEQALPLQVHFDLKERFGLPEAVMTDNTIVFHEPVRMGDVLRTHQVLRSVSEEKTTKLGTGRFWVIDVVYTNQDGELGARWRPTPASATGGPGTVVVSVACRPPRSCSATSPRATSCPPLDYEVTATTVVLGALATRDWRPMHHDKDFAVNRNGTQDIFLNTPNQAAWFERYLTDWTGPRPAGPGHLPHEGLGLPRRHHVARAVWWSRPRSTRWGAASPRWPSRCRSTATSRPRAPPASRCPGTPTTTRGPAAATSGDPRRAP